MSRQGKEREINKKEMKKKKTVSELFLNVQSEGEELREQGSGCEIVQEKKDMKGRSLFKREKKGKEVRKLSFTAAHTPLFQSDSIYSASLI